jgi:hypothetical protein
MEINGNRHLDPAPEVVAAKSEVTDVGAEKAQDEGQVEQVTAAEKIQGSHGFNLWSLFCFAFQYRSQLFFELVRKFTTVAFCHGGKVQLKVTGRNSATSSG